MQNTSGTKAFKGSGADIADFVRVKLNSDGTVSVAAATDAWIGISQEKIVVGNYGSVRLRNAPGTFQVTASGAITVGAQLYPTASGKVDDAAGTGNFTGLIAMEAATADGDIIEAVPGDILVFTAAAAQAAAPAGGTGATAGAYDTSANRDAMIATVNAMRTALINAGIMKGAA